MPQEDKVNYGDQDDLTKKKKNNNNVYLTIVFTLNYWAFKASYLYQRFFYLNMRNWLDGI